MLKLVPRVQYEFGALPKNSEDFCILNQEAKILAKVLNADKKMYLVHDNTANYYIYKTKSMCPFFVSSDDTDHIIYMTLLDGQPVFIVAEFTDRHKRCLLWSPKGQVPVLVPAHIKSIGKLVDHLLVTTELYLPPASMILHPVSIGVRLSPLTLIRVQI